MYSINPCSLFWTMSPQDFPKLLHTLLECGKNGATEREALTFWHVCARTNTGKGCHAWDGVSTWHNQKCQQKVDEESAGPLMCMCCCYLLLYPSFNQPLARFVSTFTILYLYCPYKSLHPPCRLAIAKSCMPACVWEWEWVYHVCFE